MKGKYINIVARNIELDVLIRINGPEFVLIGARASEVTDADLHALVRGEKLEGYLIN